MELLDNQRTKNKSPPAIDGQYSPVPNPTDKRNKSTIYLKTLLDIHLHKHTRHPKPHKLISNITIIIIFAEGVIPNPTMD